MKASSRTSVPKDIEPMLATLADKPFDSPDWLYELKMDGDRLVGGILQLKTSSLALPDVDPLRADGAARPGVCKL